MPISKVLGKCKMSHTDGRSANEILYDTVNVKQTDFDEYTGEMLPEGLARAAIMEEFDYLSGKKQKVIWAAAGYGEMKSDSTSASIRMRWVL